MSLSTTSPAPVLDYNTVAGQQQNMNVGAQASSNYNQVNPYGSLSYTQTGTSAQGTPIYTANTQLSAPQQQIFNTLQGTQQTAGTQASNLLSGANYGGSSPTTAIGDLTSGLTSQVMGQAVAGMTPYYKQQRDQMDTQLKNQGFKPGDPAYDQAMNGLQQNQNQSISGFEAQFEPQAFNQATNLYQMPENMALQLGAFGQPGSVNQNLAPTSALQPANLQGAASTEQQALEQQYQQQSTNQNAMLSGLFGIPTAILGGMARSTTPTAGPLASIAPYISDKRMKENIIQVGTLFDGTPVYRYRYKGMKGFMIGLMAQDVETFAPEAVGEINGVKVLEYFKATERAAQYGLRRPE